MKHKTSKKVDIRKSIQASLKEHGEDVWKLALRIHKLAEKPFEEVESSVQLGEFLKARGFRVEYPFKKIPTAFRAEWGKGKPVVGMLGEYDALPNCGIAPGTWGHGCGHNLLGTAPALGAVMAKEILGKSGGAGKIVYYGCPAEEILAGKVYMARDGAFRDLDVCLSWHPGGLAGVNAYGGSALDSIEFEFFGKTAHGASAHNGRSALDGVILLDVAANYLREHVPENVRIHSVIQEGGIAPNVVPEYASSWYYVRGANRQQVDEVRKRLIACARGAAEATETKMKWNRRTAIYERLPNFALSERLLKHVNQVGSPVATAEDKKLLKKTVGWDGEFVEEVRQTMGAQTRGSSDEDSVSWLAPLGRFNMTCYAKETTGHHRDLTAQVALPFARKGLAHAAEVFARTAIDLCQDKKFFAEVRKEFSEKTKGFTYDPLVSKRQIPASSFK